MTLTLGSLAARNARLHGDRPAFVVGGVPVSFREHNLRVNRLVHALRARGVCTGDRVSIMARNCLAYLDYYGAAEKAGFVAAPLNFRLTQYELAGVLERLRPRVLFAQAEYAELVEAALADSHPVELVLIDGGARDGWASYDTLVAEAPDHEPDASVEPDDVAYLISTSGTTGVPRAAMLTHRGQWLDAVALALEMAVVPTDRHLGTMPLYHLGGRVNVLAHNLRGCTVVLHDGFDTEAVLVDIERYEITTTQVVPTMIAWLLDHPRSERYDLSSLRLFFYASAPMPVELLRRALERFGPIFAQGYGQTESGPLVSYLHPHEHELSGPGARRLASCGRPVPDAEVRIVDEGRNELPRGEIGEIAVKSPFLMTGYWENPAATRAALADGWLYTGDMASMDADDYLYIVDRKKDMIISGGENVFPREVEEVLYGHPAVLEASVLGVPDETWGEQVKAFVVLREGEDAGPDELIGHCRERLAKYKCPKSVEFRDELPKSPSGKILKRVLREGVAA